MPYISTLEAVAHLRQIYLSRKGEKVDYLHDKPLLFFYILPLYLMKRRDFESQVR